MSHPIILHLLRSTENRRQNFGEERLKCWAGGRGIRVLGNLMRSWLSGLRFCLVNITKLVIKSNSRVTGKRVHVCKSKRATSRSLWTLSHRPHDTTARDPAGPSTPRTSEK